MKEIQTEKKENELTLEELKKKKIKNAKLAMAVIIGLIILGMLLILSVLKYKAQCQNGCSIASKYNIGTCFIIKR